MLAVLDAHTFLKRYLDRGITLPLKPKRASTSLSRSPFTTKVRLWVITKAMIITTAAAFVVVYPGRVFSPKWVKSDAISSVSSSTELHSPWGRCFIATFVFVSLILVTCAGVEVHRVAYVFFTLHVVKFNSSRRWLRYYVARARALHRRIALNYCCCPPGILQRSSGCDHVRAFARMQ